MRRWSSRRDTIATGWTACAGDAELLKPRLRELLARAAQIETGDFLHTLPKFELAADELAPAPPPQGSTPAMRSGLPAGS